MRTFVLALMTAPLLIGSAAHAASDRSPEAKLARALEGREAGEPVKCIRLSDIRSSQIYDRTAIVYEGPGGVRYVNRPDSGASSLRSSDVLVTKTHSNELCSIDVVRLYDQTARMPSGFVGLGEFVPYRKIAAK